MDQRRSSQPGVQRALLLAGLTATTLLLGIAAANGPGRPGHAGRAHLPQLPRATATSTAVASPRADATPLPRLDQPSSPPPAWLGTALNVIALLALVLVVGLIIRRVVRLRPMEHVVEADAPAVTELEVQVDAEEMAESLRTSLDEVRTAEDFDAAIVAAWRRLEDLAARSGAVREPWQSTAEFSVEVLQHTPAQRSDLVELAAIYERACYGSTAPTLAERDAAQTCLGRLSGQLESSVRQGEQP